MATDAARRSVTIERTPEGRPVAVNVRGGRLPIGGGDGPDFTPVELFLAAIGSCTAIDVATLTSRRAEPDEFEVRVEATKVRDQDGNRLTDIEVTFRVAFPQTPEGDAAREILPEMVRRSHDRLCVVSRTVELGTPVATGVATGLV